jgi:hypothetical protein
VEVVVGGGGTVEVVVGAAAVVLDAEVVAVVGGVEVVVVELLADDFVFALGLVEHEATRSDATTTATSMKKFAPTPVLRALLRFRS